ncbi:MAG: hypothetical protein PVH41_01980 [Anaerolineae bacterium]|jgi:hypothetical protein
MQEANVEGKLVAASPDAPATGTYPYCGAQVQKRHVTRMDGTVTCFYRHKRGQGKDCPRRYRPT